MTPRETRFAIDGLTAMVIVSVAGALAILTWRIAGEAGSGSPVEAAIRSHVPPAPAPDISPIINLPPFGRAATMAAPAGEVARLTLRGTMLANPASASSALIEVEGGAAALFKIGEAIPGGGILERIDVDYVVIRFGNGLFALYFPGDERAGAGVAAGEVVGGQADAPAAARLAPGVPAPPPPNVSGIPGHEAPPPVSPVNTSQSLIDSIGATATPEGYRVGPNPSQQMRAAGLRPGDIVVSVEGVDPSRFAADAGMVRRTMAAGQVRVEVLRDGSRLSLSLPLR
jgi:general secretion pathway protein C